MLLFCLKQIRNVLGLVRRGESLRVEVGSLLVPYHGQWVHWRIYMIELGYSQSLCCMFLSRLVRMCKI